MSENDTSSVQGETPNTDMPVTGNAPGGATPQEPTLSLEEAMKRIADLEHAHKNAREQADRQAKKLAAYEKAEQERQAMHDAYTRQMQERIIRYEVERQAAKMHIIDPDAAVRLLDMSELEYDENGTPTNADKLLEKLLKSKPYLAPKQEEPAASEPPARGTPAIPAMNPGRTNIASQGSLPPGKLSMAEAYAAVQRQRQ